MEDSIHDQLAALRRLTVNELRSRYQELFGDSTNNRNRVWLIRRILWRMQALAEGGLTERAKRRAAELADEADLRITVPRSQQSRPDIATAIPPSSGQQDDRLPAPGSILVRKYKGQVLQVEVLDHGFAFAGQTYASLSAVAKAITGSHCNGFLFFRISGGQR